MLVRSREILFVFLLSLLLSWMLSDVFLALTGLARQTWGFLVLALSFYAFLVVFLLLLTQRWQIETSLLFGRSPTAREALALSRLAVPLVLLSVGVLYLVYLPLSFAAPQLAEWAFDDAILIETDGTFPPAANVVNFLLAVVGAPFTEELLFRGFLLRRWARKWGLLAGILFSSVAFGALHPTDVVGATVFGVVMSLLYARSGSLWFPIVVHGANNLLAFGLVVLEQVTGVGLGETLPEFQARWWIGLVSLVLGGAWFCRYIAREWPGEDWRFPSVSREFAP